MRHWRKAIPLTFGLLAACASTDVSTPVEPGYKPKQTSTEAGLWMQMDRFEKRLANSELVERDDTLNQYVRGVLCRVTPDHCQDIQLFIIKNPYFNATMAPNGSLHVWTGLLLRVQNEDQLASVLGHEMAHYLGRHSLQQWNTTKATMEFLTFFNIATGGLGFFAMLGAAGGLQAYSQDFEFTADQEGLEMVHRAGYDADETVKLWELIHAEKEAVKEDTPSVFWASHPPTEERIMRLTVQSANLKKKDSVATAQGPSRFREIYRQYWHKWAHNLVSVSNPEEAEVVFAGLIEGGRDVHDVAFFQGEVYRRKGKDDDLEKAIAYYKKASSVTPAPLKTYKNMGLIAKRQKNTEMAKRYFELYLQENPNGSDEKLVRIYIDQLGN